MFRMNKEGTRVADYNCCPNSQAALQVIGENAVKYSDILRSTTGRYFYWIDDGRPMCSCDRCKNFSDSEQALLIENAIVKALRKSHPRASVAHLAYINTMRPPVQVKPEEGVFLEFAPIYRSWRKPLTDRNATADVNKEGDGSLLTHGQTLELLSANLKVFPRATAQVLEYWLDVSLQSRWKKPAKKIDWVPDVCKSDVDTYVKAGITHITTFAGYIDGTYKNNYRGLTFIKEYGQILERYPLEESKNK